MARKDTDFIYYGEAKKELMAMISDTAMNLMYHPIMSEKGMEAEEVAAHDARVAHHNNGILTLAMTLIARLEDDREADPDE